ncbi:MAG: asparagine synthase-related protein, partial [Actinomycetota bacterium]|nr:asparagine synthase-related protein [Actinomycetota bacterium]
RLEEAVAERVSEAGGTAAHFSGGFDSTGLALLAELALGDRGRQLEALTLAYPNSPVLAGERHYVEAALRGRTGLRHRWVDIGEYLELDGHESFPALDEPSAKAVDYLPSLLLTEAAEAAGADTLLVGHGGDQMFFRSSTGAVASLLRAGKLRRARELARAWAPGGRSAPVLQAAAQRALPISVRNGVGAVLTTGRETDELLRHLNVPPWIDPVFADRTGVARRSRALGGPRLESPVFGPRDLPFAAGDWYHWNVAVPRGVTQSRPYFDPRVIRTALGLPVELHLARGQNKAVLGAALADELPEVIVTRRDKINVNEFRAGFARHRRWLEQLVATAPIREGVIDRQALTECVGDVAVGIHDRFSLWRLRMALTYLLWLSDRERWAAQRVPFLSRAEVR